MVDETIMKKLLIGSIIAIIIIFSLAALSNAIQGVDPIAQRQYAEAALIDARANANVSNALVLNSQISVMAVIVIGTAVIASFAGGFVLLAARKPAVTVMYLPPSQHGILNESYQMVCPPTQKQTVYPMAQDSDLDGFESAQLPDQRVGEGAVYLRTD